MKSLPLSGPILLLYLVYTTFVPVSTSHSLIIFSLALLTAFEMFLKLHQTPSIEKKLQGIKEDMDKEMEGLHAKLLELKQEQSRLAIERASANASVSIKKTPIKF